MGLAALFGMIDHETSSGGAKWGITFHICNKTNTCPIAYAVRVFKPERIDENPATFHARAFDTTPLDAGGAMWVPSLQTAKTLVLGSSQPEATVDAAYLEQANIGIARRRSGGGAVLVSHDDIVWFDIITDRTHPHWDDDVVRSFEWLGLACQRALTSLGIDTEMHTGRLITSPWSSTICFAGIGPGELVIDSGTTTRKVVGISQRRTRDRARFQVAILRRWSGTEHASMLALSPAERVEASAALDSSAVGVTASPDALLTHIETELNRS